jgi:activator of 2-hydroxyglutaryl-CoA dehydratase
MREAWQTNIPRMWKDRKVEIPEGTTPEELIKVPENAQYFAALGSVEFGKEEEPEIGRYLGTDKLLYYIDFGRAEEKVTSGGKGLVAEDAELVAFKSAYAKKKFDPAEFYPGQVVSGFIGIDAGSTSTKAAVLDKNGEILSKNYQLSNGNPIQDTIEAFEKASSADRIQGRASLQVLRIRVETIDYFLGRYREDIVKRGNTERDIEAQLSVFERSLRGQADSRPDIAMAGN